MIRLPLFCVAAALVAAVSAPAQRAAASQRVSHPRTSASFGDHGPRNHRDAGEHSRRVSLPLPFPVRVQTPVPARRGHWEERCEQVLVPGYWTEEHVPPTYGWIRGHCGRLEWGMVDPGGCRQVWVPARYEHQTRRVWVAC